MFDCMINVKYVSIPIYDIYIYVNQGGMTVRKLEGEFLKRRRVSNDTQGLLWYWILQTSSWFVFVFFFKFLFIYF